MDPGKYSEDHSRRLLCGVYGKGVVACGVREAMLTLATESQGRPGAGSIVLVAMTESGVYSTEYLWNAHIQENNKPWRISHGFASAMRRLPFGCAVHPVEVIKLCYMSKYINLQGPYSSSVEVAELNCL